MTPEDYREWLDHPCTLGMLDYLSHKKVSLSCDVVHKVTDINEFFIEKGRILGIEDTIADIKELCVLK